MEIQKNISLQRLFNSVFDRLFTSHRILSLARSLQMWILFNMAFIEFSWCFAHALPSLQCLNRKWIQKKNRRLIVVYFRRVSSFRHTSQTSASSIPKPGYYTGYYKTNVLFFSTLKFFTPFFTSRNIMRFRLLCLQERRSKNR